MSSPYAEYLRDLRSRLLAKKEREKEYLDRRARRGGTHTPTDDAYNQDQILEAEILAVLDNLIREKSDQRQDPDPGPKLGDRPGKN